MEPDDRVLLVLRLLLYVITYALYIRLLYINYILVSCMNNVYISSVLFQDDPLLAQLKTGNVGAC